MRTLGNRLTSKKRADKPLEGVQVCGASFLLKKPAGHEARSIGDRRCFRLPQTPACSTPSLATIVADSRLQRSARPPRPMTTPSAPSSSTRSWSPTSGSRAPSRPIPLARHRPRGPRAGRQRCSRGAVHRFDTTLASDFLAFAVPSIRGRYAATSATTAEYGPASGPGAPVAGPRRPRPAPLRKRPARHEGAIAEALDVPVQDVVEALRAEGCFSPSSLDVPLSEVAPRSSAMRSPRPRR